MSDERLWETFENPDVAAAVEAERKKWLDITAGWHRIDTGHREHISTLEERLRLIVSAAEEVTSWDWLHLLADHPDAETVKDDVKRLDFVLSELERVSAPQNESEGSK